jgi:hypothetical protein
MLYRYVKSHCSCDKLIWWSNTFHRIKMKTYSISILFKVGIDLAEFYSICEINSTNKYLIINHIVACTLYQHHSLVDHN